MIQAVLVGLCFSSAELNLNGYRFRDTAAYEEFLGSSVLLELKYICEKNQLLSAPQIDEHLLLESGFFSRSNDKRIHIPSELLIASGVFHYAASMVPNALADWKKVTDATEENEEDGSLTYAFMSAPTKPDKVYSFEVYTSEEYYKSVHVVSDAILQCRTDQAQTRLKLDGRFFEQEWDNRAHDLSSINLL